MPGETVKHSIGDGASNSGVEARSIHSIAHPIALFDRAGLLVFANQAYRHLLEPILSSSLHEQTYAEIHERWREELSFSDAMQRATFWESSHGQGDWRADWEASTRDGRTLRIIDQRMPDGSLVEVIWDRTQEARLLAELMAARVSAEAASAAKSEFLASMSHELRTPLNAMLGFAQLLQRNAAGLADRPRRQVEHILKAGEHVLRLVDDVLDLSRIEAGRITIGSDPVDVLHVLEEVLTTLGPAADAAGIRVEVATSRDVPMIAADGTRFAQILMNFGSNALKYNRPGGSVTFAVSDHREFVRVTVVDTGLGIPADKQARLFLAFERAGREAGPIEGTGLGLVIAKRLAECMGGRVGFRSVFQKGSEFWVEIPVHPLATNRSAGSGIRKVARPNRDPNPQR